MSALSLCANPACGQPFKSRRGFRYCCHRCSFVRQSLAERFWPKVQRCTHEPWCIYCCWPWIGSRKPQGYGQIAVRVDGKSQPMRTNRVAWELFHGRPLPEGLWALHSCDVPPCCNPAHIYPGTRAQNTLDAMKRGRLVGRYHGDHRGAKAAGARLHEEDIPTILQWSAQGWTGEAIAQAMGVRPSTISCILSGKTWLHATFLLSAESCE